MIEETYQRQLATIATSAADLRGVVLLVPTTDTDHAAAMANDLAQLIGRSGTGHTLLFCFEESPAALDHEIGVEQDLGVPDILSGGVTLARAAAHGRARGFIYVPAGERARGGAELLRSPAWGSLAGSASARGATVLAFVPRSGFYKAVGGGLPERPRIGGLVWLGPEPTNLPAGFRIPVLGALEPPGAVARDGSGAESRKSRDPGAETAAAGARLGRRRRRASKGGPRKALAGVLVVIVLAAMAVAAVSMIRGSRSESLVPENDPLWLQPLETDSTDQTADSLVAGTRAGSPSNRATG